MRHHIYRYITTSLLPSLLVTLILVFLAMPAVIALLFSLFVILLLTLVGLVLVHPSIIRLGLPFSLYLELLLSPFSVFDSLLLGINHVSPQFLALPLFFMFLFFNNSLVFWVVRVYD